MAQNKRLASEWRGEHRHTETGQTWVQNKADHGDCYRVLLKGQKGENTTVAVLKNVEITSEKKSCKRTAKRDNEGSNWVWRIKLRSCWKLHAARGRETVDPSCTTMLGMRRGWHGNVVVIKKWDFNVSIVCGWQGNPSQESWEREKKREDLCSHLDQ